MVIPARPQPQRAVPNAGQRSPDIPPFLKRQRPARSSPAQLDAELPTSGQPQPQRPPAVRDRSQGDRGHPLTAGPVLYPQGGQQRRSTRPVGPPRRFVSPPRLVPPPSPVLLQNLPSPGEHRPPPFGPIHPPGESLPQSSWEATSKASRPGFFQSLTQQLGLSLRPQRLLWLGGGLLALSLFLSNGLGRWGNGLIAKSFHRDLCQEMVQPSASLSRSQLTELLTVPERSPKDAIRQQAPAPYCTLSEMEVRAGVMAQREAYPLAFDPDTWLVMLYEGDEYAGYAFRFE